MQTSREALSRTSALTTCTFLRPATAALRWVEPAGFRTTAKTVALGLLACEQENEYSVAKSRRKLLHQLQNIFEADSSRSTNDSVGRHCSRIAGCKMGFCEFDPPAFMAPRCGLRFAAPGSGDVARGLRCTCVAGIRPPCPLNSTDRGSQCGILRHVTS